MNIVCYGLAFKPDIDDLRESPALQIAKSIAQLHSGKTLGVEPNIRALPPDIDYIELMSLENAKVQAGIHVLLVDHREFKEHKITSEYVVDTKGIWC